MKITMSANEGRDARTATSSSIVSSNEHAERDFTALVQVVRTARRSVAQLDESFDATVKEMYHAKSRHGRAVGQLALLKRRVGDLQIHCEQFTKTNEEVSSKITDLKERIAKEKSHDLEMLKSQYRHICNLHDLETANWSPATVKRMAAALRIRQSTMQERSRYLDAVIEGKLAATEQAAAEVTDLEPEERQASRQAFGDEGEAVRRVLDLIKQKQQELEDQIKRLDKK